MIFQLQLKNALSQDVSQIRPKAMTRREILKTISDLLRWLIVKSVTQQETGLIQHASWMYRRYKNPMGLATGVGIKNRILSSLCAYSVPLCKI